MESLSVREAHTERQIRKRSIIGTVFAIVSALILGSYIVLGVLLYRRSGDMFLRELKNNALDNSKTIAASVDAAAFSRLYYGCEGNDDYNSVMDTLCVFRDNSGLQYVYTCWYDESGEIPVMCVDSDPVDPGDMGDALGYAEATHLALHGTPAVYDKPVTDDWGAHLSAFAPIVYEGTVYGAVGVDVDYAWVASQLRGMVWLIVLICAVCFALSIMLLAVFSRYLKRKFRLLDTKIDELSYDATGIRKIDGLNDGDEFEMIAEHINAVFEKNAEAQMAEADKLRSAMAEVEKKADEKMAAAEEKLEVAEGRLAQAAYLMEEGEGVAVVAEPVEAPGEEELLAELDDSITKEEAIRRVREVTPKLLDAYRSMQEMLQPYFGVQTDEDLPEIDPDELNEIYEAILEFAEMYDDEAIRRLLEQTDGYAVPEAEKERFARVKECVAVSDWGALKEALGG